jgi:hypothetical protein
LCPKLNFQIYLYDSKDVVLENRFFENMNESYKNLLLQNEIQLNLLKVSFELDLTYGLFVNFLHKMSSKFFFQINSTKNLNNNF